jgi:MYXO-CTERM domain-containing protein
VGTLHPLPDARVDAQGCGIGDEIFVVGGIGVGEEESFVADTIFIYDTVDDEWSEGAAMPEGRFDHAVACDAGRGLVFVIGGQTPFDDEGVSDTTTTIWAYDVANDSWDETLTDADGTWTSHSAKLIDADTILVAGGYYEDFLSVETYLYDIENDTWTATGDLPWERLLNASAMLPPGRMCLIGGTSFAGGSYNANDDSYDCYSEGYWIPQVATLGLARTYLTGTNMGDSMVLVGGVEIDPEDSPFQPAVYNQSATIERYPTGDLPDEPPVEPVPDAAPDAAPDAGPDAAPDTGTPDAAPDTGVPDVTVDAAGETGAEAGPSQGGGGGDDDGCGCTAAPSGGAQSGALMLLGLFFGLFVLRRRR